MSLVTLRFERVGRSVLAWLRCHRRTRAVPSGLANALSALPKPVLPYAYQLIAALARELQSSNREFADNLTPPPSEAERGQLLRALASNSIRGSFERHFGVALAFQNCPRVAAFRPKAHEWADIHLVHPTRSQILNQSPEFRDC
ncbi:SCO5389 family protein [Actinacidiphila oryziradicis]|uniref:SCO5389 family protein n=1 Tax=Actinacidiphila oryziradicis TaxID=2571141 RepID=UPI00267E0E51|nr:SCO5389 family protein [Actinacidiphila oryziradicis]